MRRMKRRRPIARTLGALSLVFIPLVIYMVGITIDQARQVGAAREQAAFTVLRLADQEFTSLIYRTLSGREGVTLSPQNLGVATINRIHSLLSAGNQIVLVAPQESPGLMIVAARARKNDYVARAIAATEIERQLARTLLMPRYSLGIINENAQLLAGTLPEPVLAHCTDIVKTRSAGTDIARSAMGDGDILLTPTAHSNITIVLAGASSAFARRGVLLDSILIVLMVSFGIVASILLTDETIFARLDGIARIANAHSRGRFGVRYRAAKGVPVELHRLGMALNEMADSSARQVASLEASEGEKNRLILELHHRVKNNFQVLESLLSLMKKGKGAEDSAHIRFIEDHVRAMAVADRTAYGIHGMRASFEALVTGVIESLRTTAGLPATQVHLETSPNLGTLDLDRAVALCLFLSAAVPPSFDHLKTGGTAIRIRVTEAEGGQVYLDFIDTHVEIESMSQLRQRLVNAYTKQLDATQSIFALEGQSIYRVTIPGVQPLEA